MQKRLPKHLVIVGGGTAGWMSANLFAHYWSRYDVRITLIESARIGTLGVGEGSTPFLKEFFQILGIEEQQWMPACNATFKCGIRFPGWTSGTGSYFHPFYSDLDGKQAQEFFAQCNNRRAGHAIEVSPDPYFYATSLANRKKAPKTPTPGFDDFTYGYHFDAVLLARFLKQHATQHGVTHIDDIVQSVQLDKQGNIALLDTESHGPIRADFFVDCSGFEALLIQKTLGEDLVAYSDQLFCDRAVAIQSAIDPGQIPCETLSMGLRHGWAWRIPLRNRFGNGYVYSSRFTDAEQAENELREMLGESALDAPALHLQWIPGRIAQHWKHNCLAVGLSQGFLEPLEAPMLFIIQRTILGFIEQYEQDSQRERFNAGINNMIDGTRDYLQAHYKINSREDTPFWRACRDNPAMSETLQDILSAWKRSGNFDDTLAKHQQRLAYLKTSWYCLLAGKSYFNELQTIGADPKTRTPCASSIAAATDSFFDHAHFLSALYDKQHHENSI
ncbi:tryptophan 7-halogenase [Aliiglaciecola sp. CAU 1673]|uniref:tryptophan halogenase family protein n=1 Tax=Aliiglaciecola sp. CAU 1673 TaxID=3032595 RepID=UPI0023D9B530|nr:tryptophan halogenase family protein [Aliiglaciecola sp. CAU 1673]MDF2178539.1 tryptophan 7-halogenase [Aliiglaciecola sp. CAU 1673]